jgi:phenylalanyl-tRNA synthetase alpha chain
MDGRELNVIAADGWVEVGECGVAHPEVLARAGLPGWSGLAMGLGLDRLLMLRKGVPDIRLLRSDDPRIAAQWEDLRPYRPVSHLPSIVRDISVAVVAGAVEEEIGDQVRAALGPDADLLEEVRILSATPYRGLPERARERLGIGAGQQNLLVRLVIRPLVATLTDAQANELRDRVYRAVHQGACSG